ncbi:MAG: VWA domain-containing protein [Byssovorax sp.]
MHAPTSVSTSPRRTAADVTIALTVRFGASILGVAHLTPPRAFHLGERGHDGDCDIFLPESTLGVPRAPLIVVEDGVVSLVLLAAMEGTLRLGEDEDTATIDKHRARLTGRPHAAIPGAILVPFPLGSEAEIALGEVTIEIAATPAVPCEIGRTRPAPATLVFLGLSALTQVGLLGAFATAPPIDPEERSAAQIYAIQAALQEVEEKQQDRLAEEQAAIDAAESARDRADNKEGGTGTRARGEEASMGNPAIRSSGSRYGVAGPADNPDPHIARAAALRDAAEYGMIGLLSSGAGGDPIGASPPPSASPPPPAARVAPPAAASEPLDPNGRFATTYRPGGGHLAAFESAVSRGIIAPAARELVNDVGARYTPDTTVPPSRALGLRADLERRELPPGGGPLHLRLALRGSADHPAARPHLSVHLVLDVSGSMQGESIARARSAADALVDRLAPTDDFSLVTFSSDADLLVPDGPVGPRRASIHQVIRGIHEDGGTNIGAGLELGYAEASAPTIPDDAVRVVLLVSDGHANAGITRTESLSRLAEAAFQRGVQTSSFGLGADYDGALMSSIAAEGAGGYYYLRDAAQIAPALAMELDRRLDPVATAVELRVRLEPDIKLLHVYGSRRLNEAEAARVRSAEIASDQQAQKRDHIKQDRQEDREGGMRFFMPAFARDDAHALLLQVDVPAGLGGRRIAGIELKYKDRLHRRNVVDEIPITTSFADSDGKSASTIDASVSRAVQGFAAGESLAEASTRIARGDRSGAASLLAERELILRRASESLHEPLLLRDADRLASLRGHTSETNGLGDPLVLAMLLETSGRAHLH